MRGRQWRRRRAQTLGFRARGGCGLGESPRVWGGSYRGPWRCLGVRARGGGGGDSAGTSRTRAWVRCGAGDEGPDRRAPPVSLRARERGKRAR
jgi:hypothetical protein